MKQGLPGIKWIAWKYCQQLPAEIMMKTLAHVSFNIVANWTVIEIIGKAEYELQESNDSNHCIEDVTITFRTRDIIPTHADIAFIIKTVNGESYIVGQKEKPYPEVKMKATSGAPGANENVNEYQVTFSARKALIPLNL